MPDNTVKEFQKLDEESASVVIQPSGARFGRILCGSCRRPIWYLLEMMLMTVLDDPKVPQEEKDEFERKVEGTDDLNKKAATLLSFLNKGRGHDALLKCPGCKKILFCDL